MLIEMEYFKERLDKPIVLFDKEFDNSTFGKVRIVGLNLGTHPTAYVGIPKGNVLYGKEYNKSGLYAIINVHGGLTYSGAGDGDYLPEGYWWFGWDYAHTGDFMGYYNENEHLGRTSYKYSTTEIFFEASSVISEFEIVEKTLRYMCNQKVR